MRPLHGCPRRRTSSRGSENLWLPARKHHQTLKAIALDKGVLATLNQISSHQRSILPVECLPEVVLARFDESESRHKDVIARLEKLENRSKGQVTGQSGQGGGGGGHGGNPGRGGFGGGRGGRGGYGGYGGYQGGYGGGYYNQDQTPSDTLNSNGKRGAPNQGGGPQKYQKDGQGGNGHDGVDG
jgi:hypothetical protein